MANNYTLTGEPSSFEVNEIEDRFPSHLGTLGDPARMNVEAISFPSVGGDNRAAALSELKSTAELIAKFQQEEQVRLI